MVFGEASPSESTKEPVMFETEIKVRTLLGTLVVTGALLCQSGCASDSYAAQGAAKGAGTGALAGLWVEVLTEADRQQTDAAAALLPDIVDKDREISDTAVAQARLDEALGEIGEIRTQYDLAASCSDQ
jgi:hypothetical protein